MRKNVGKFNYFSESGMWLGKILANGNSFTKSAKVFLAKIFRYTVCVYTLSVVILIFHISLLIFAHRHWFCMLNLHLHNSCNVYCLLNWHNRVTQVIQYTADADYTVNERFFFTFSDDQKVYRKSTLKYRKLLSNTANYTFYMYMYIGYGSSTFYFNS